MDSQGRQGIDEQLHRLKHAYSESNKRLQELTNLPELSEDEHDEALSLAQYMSLLNLQKRRLQLRVQRV
jgi:hypothetical protein